MESGLLTHQISVRVSSPGMYVPPPPFCRASGGYIDPTALATGLTAADDTARYAHVLSLGESRCGQKRQAKHEHHK